MKPGGEIAVKNLEAAITKPVVLQDDPLIQWPGEVPPLVSHQEGNWIVIILNILPHDYCLLRLESTVRK